jgi:hypothetical protein
MRWFRRRAEERPPAPARTGPPEAQVVDIEPPAGATASPAPEPATPVVAETPPEVRERTPDPPVADAPDEASATPETEAEPPPPVPAAAGAPASATPSPPAPSIDLRHWHRAGGAVPLPAARSGAARPSARVSSNGWHRV